MEWYESGAASSVCQVAVIMKRIPETFILSEDDIREAIALWLNQQHIQSSSVEYDFDITFDVQVKREIPKGLGGMTDGIEAKVITAKAVMDD